MGDHVGLAYHHLTLLPGLDGAGCADEFSDSKLWERVSLMNQRLSESMVNAEPTMDLSTEQLSELIQQKSVLVRELHKLVSKQQAMIRDQEVDLIPLLAVKQKVLEALTVVDRSMDPFRQQDPETRRWVSPEARIACRQEAERCETLFREVLLMENDCTRTLQEQQMKTREQLQGAVAAGHASRAYQQATPRPHYQASLDLTSEG